MSEENPQVEQSASSAPETTEASDAPVEAVEAAEGESSEQLVPKELVIKELPEGQYYWGTGRRKASVARVRIRPGSGQFVVNKRDVDTYFTEDKDRAAVVAPLKVTNTAGRFDVFVNVKGGGYTGQAGAILLGVSRALKTFDDSLDSTLRNNGFLTRDAREVERKKYGQPGARRRFQFSKR